MTLTVYEGLFGWLCRHAPLLDADAPPDWFVIYRAWNRTVWYYHGTGALITCKNGSSGWSIHVYEHDTGRRQMLPQNASRRRAFRSIRSFFDGEPLLVADPDHGADGLLTKDQLEVNE